MILQKLQNDSSDLLSVDKVRTLEHQLEREGVSLSSLMELAGGSISEYLAQRFDKTHTALIFCGSGNNGGDGWVVARNLAQQDYGVTVVSHLLPEELQAEPARSAAMGTACLNLSTLNMKTDPSDSELRALLLKADIIVDAILGIGFTGNTIKEPYRSWVSSINEARERVSHPLVLAADVPSGLDADTGRTADPCVVADVTITMLTGKPGLAFMSSQAYCGEVYVAPLVETG